MYAVYWGASILWCEHLTDKYSQNYVDKVLEDVEPERLHKFKVISCKHDYVKIYYVLNHYETMEPAYGFVAEFKNGERINPEVSDKCVWSSYGSADGFVWPYGR